MSGELMLLLALLLIGILASAFFSGIETGVYSMNRLRLSLLAERQGQVRAKLLHSIVSREDLLLCVFLIGNNLANGLTAQVGEILASGWLPDPRWSAVVTALLLTPVLFMTSEAVPKHLFRLHSESWPYASARTLSLSRLLLAPLVLLVLPLSRLALKWAKGRKRSMAGLRRGGLGLETLLAAGSRDASSMRGPLLQLESVSRGPVRDFVVSTQLLDVLPEDADSDALLEALRVRAFHRYPLRAKDGELRRYVYYFEVLAAIEEHGGKPLRLLDHSHPIIEIGRELTVDDALVRLETEQSRLALVRGPSGAAMGVVFIRDLVAGLLSQEH